MYKIGDSLFYVSYAACNGYKKDIPKITEKKIVQIKEVDQLGIVYFFDDNTDVCDSLLKSEILRPHFYDNLKDAEDVLIEFYKEWLRSCNKRIKSINSELMELRDLQLKVLCKKEEILNKNNKNE